jgi:hypothetical protein
MYKYVYIYNMNLYTYVYNIFNNPFFWEWQAAGVRCLISFDHHTHIERW